MFVNNDIQTARFSKILSNDKIISENNNINYKSNSFYSMVKDCINKVNNTLVESDANINKFIVDPSSVSVHKVMISMSKAEMTLSLTKIAVNKVVSGYKQIINLR